MTRHKSHLLLDPLAKIIYLLGNMLGPPRLIAHGIDLVRDPLKDLVPSPLAGILAAGPMEAIIVPLHGSKYYAFLLWREFFFRVPECWADMSSISAKV